MFQLVQRNALSEALKCLQLNYVLVHFSFDIWNMEFAAKVYICLIWPVDTLVILAIREHSTGLKVSDERKPANYQSSPLALTSQTGPLRLVGRVLPM